MEKKTIQFEALQNMKGKVGWAMLWLLGVPLPILLVIYFLRGCQ